ncbi:MAG: tRNA (adenosine(37)-N6)-threonylcarbamoyltransferase complex dimerization subunit type 1 TsaB [Acidimicrobiales bacterium]
MTGPVVLAIESATSCVGCAVGTPDGVIASTYSARGRRHAESLAPQIEFVVTQAGLAIADIACVAVDIGPGLYTGLRVGITTARAMAHMLDVPMVPVTSLEAIAHANRAGGDMVVAVDARRGEVFHAAFTVAADGTLAGTEAAVGTVAELEYGTGRRIVGDGGVARAEEFAAAGHHVDREATHLPLPDVVLSLAVGRLDEAVPAHEIHPLYLRRPDAVAKWEGA